MKEIQAAIESFVGESTEDVTPDMILAQIRFELQDPNFEADINIVGNDVIVDGIVFSLKVSF